jgi:hypothetical protein
MVRRLPAINFLAGDTAVLVVVFSDALRHPRPVATRVP